MGEVTYTVEREKCVLVGLITRHQNEQLTQEYLDELSFLALTAGADEVKRYTQQVDKPNAGTYIGAGKVEEIKTYVLDQCIDMVIFDDELTPTQLRNLEKEFNINAVTPDYNNVKVLDRNSLILDIFAQRARTAYAKTQVELAQHEYLLPRLTRMWTHLERQKGGIGMRGPGETQIETDRRIIKQKIALLKEKLAKIDKQMATQRSNRGQMVRVALVGYTNVGKSSLMTLLSKSDVFAENKLFATLDTTVRKVVIENLPFLLSDTVGFIRKLPTQLVESFKSTLDETREADLLLHVVDIAHPQFEEQYEVVNETLRDIGAGDKPVLLIFNKIDAYEYLNEDPLNLALPDNTQPTLEELQESWMQKLNPDNVIFISVLQKTNLEELRSLLYQKIKAIHAVRYPYNNFLY
ncbi:MAG: GTPase HflX [Luteibaculaceae bacterium]